MIETKRIRDIATRLDAIGQWQIDQVCFETGTGKLLKDAAELLNRLATATCAQGIIGCYAGERCTSDHK